MATISGTADKTHTAVPAHAFVAARGNDANKMLLPFTYAVTSTVTATATVAIFNLPPGRHRIIPELSRVQLTIDGQGTATVSVGLGAYTKPNGVAVGAAVAGLVASIELEPTHTATTDLTVVGQTVDSVGPVAVTAALLGDSPKLAVATTLSGFLCVAREAQ